MEHVIIKISRFADFEQVIIKISHFDDFEQVKQYYQQNSLGRNRMPNFFFNFFLQYIRMVKPTKYKQRQTVKNNGTKN